MSLGQRIKHLSVNYLYDILVTISVPFFLSLIYTKGRRNPDYRKPLAQRLARGLENYPTKPIWFHAVSDGEFYAARRLINEFLTAYPNTPILITTTTPTGKDRVETAFASQLDERVWHAYLPFDQGCVTRRFLRKIKPIIAIFVETEIWPNFLESLEKANTPTALINARLSEKSFLGYRNFGLFAANTMNRFSLISAQDKASSQRFKHLLSPIAQPKTKLTVSGNLKLDISPPKDLNTQLRILSSALSNAPFWVAGSTHIGEDEIVISAHTDIIKRHPKYKLVIAPRHPERSCEIQSLCTEHGFTPVLYSELKKATSSMTSVSLPSFDMVIVDSIGELLYFYALCDVAVIAGSFIEHGGHNPLEACLFRKPIITGPHYINFQSMIDELLEANAIKLTNENMLAESVTSLIDNPEPYASNGYDYLKSNNGTTEVTFNLLHDLLEQRSNYWQ